MDYNLFLVLVKQRMLIQGVKAFATPKVFPTYFAVKRKLIITNRTPFGLSFCHSCLL